MNREMTADWFRVLDCLIYHPGSKPAEYHPFVLSHICLCPSIYTNLFD